MQVVCVGKWGCYGERCIFRAVMGQLLPSCCGPYHLSLRSTVRSFAARDTPERKTETCRECIKRGRLQAERQSLMLNGTCSDGSLDFTVKAVFRVSGYWYMLMRCVCGGKLNFL